MLSLYQGHSRIPPKAGRGARKAGASQNVLTGPPEAGGSGRTAERERSLRAQSLKWNWKKKRELLKYKKKKKKLEDWVNSRDCLELRNLVAGL